LVLNIPVRWSRFLGAILLGCLAALAASAQSLETVASAYRKTPNARTRAALLRFVERHRSDKDGALALLVLGATEIDERQFGDALQHLKSAQKRLPQLADYTAYLVAVSESEMRDFPELEKTLEPVWNFAPASPLAGKAVVLQAEAYLQDGQPAKAVALVQRHLADVAEPQSNLLLARGFEASGQATEAARQYQKIYVDYPLAKEASDAEAALARYPALPPQAQLERGTKLLDRGDYSRAAKQLTTAATQLTGAELDMARVRIGVAQYSGRDYKPAYEQLTSFQSSSPEQEAERLFYLMECARHLDRVDEMTATLDKLSTSYPASRWRMQALISVANYDSGHNQPDAAEPLLRTCSDTFSTNPESAQCQWKLAWTQYLSEPAAAQPMFEEHLKRYPDSDRVTTALYFLGRIAESKSDWPAARVYYETLDNSFPNYYYAMLARDHLRSPQFGSAGRSPEALQFVGTLRLPKRLNPSFEANAATQRRLDRAHLLASVSLDDLAEGELRFGAKTDGQSNILALELANLANQRESPDEGIRYIKRYAPGYLSLSLDNAPEKFWKAAFPIPYRSQLEQYCRSLSLDPYLVAALIRQESEFNPKAVSRANARGLTQVMPATGRQLSRKLGIPGYRTSLLFNPDTNLKIGTYYLKALSDQLEGKWEATLASYNAGKSRVLTWLGTANYHEPAEFVESIPFNETRGYVESVLRNAEIYRRLYGPKTN